MQNNPSNESEKGEVSGKTIKNLNKAAERIKKAAEKNERIVIYGDTDLDGVVSVVVLKEALQNLGRTRPFIYFPNREKEGYGINKKALAVMRRLSPALMIALDCGIGNFEEVMLAKKMGFEVIIIDHHEILKKIPNASIVVDPKQKGDEYPFKEFAAAGIVFKLAELLLGREFSISLRRSFAEIVALATIADMMVRTGDNKVLIGEGLRTIRESSRAGIKVFFEPEFSKAFNATPENLNDYISKMNSLLNVRDVQKGLPASYRMLTVNSLEVARNILRRLIKKNVNRRKMIEATVKQVEERIADRENDNLVFEGSSNWDIVFLSPVASIICQKFNKPVFIYRKEKKETQGTVRMPSGTNGVKALLHCSRLLKTYGGHPGAAGFRIINSNLEKFKKCLINYFKKQ